MTTERSPWSQEDALDTLARAERDPAERTMLERILAAYHITLDNPEDIDHFHAFAEWLGLVPDEDALRLYAVAHSTYAAAWNKYGWEGLLVMKNRGWESFRANGWRLL